MRGLMLIDVLESFLACETACDWVAHQSFEHAWHTCPRWDWMFWFVQTMYRNRCVTYKTLQKITNALDEVAYMPVYSPETLLAFQKAKCEAVRNSVSFSTIKRGYTALRATAEEVRHDTAV